MSEHLPETQYLDPEVLQKLGDLEWVAREVVEGLRVGSHRSPLRGFSTEFAHHRQYSPGDPIRSIDWRVFGRTEKYFTKLYEAETNFDCHILVDSSASMTYGSGKVSKLEYAKFLAASIAYMVLKQRDSVGLSVFDFDVCHSGDRPHAAGDQADPENDHRQAAPRHRDDDEAAFVRGADLGSVFRCGRHHGGARSPEIRRAQRCRHPDA
jgi:hypothetical protein